MLNERKKNNVNKETTIGRDSTWKRKSFVTIGKTGLLLEVRNFQPRSDFYPRRIQFLRSITQKRR